MKKILCGKEYDTENATLVLKHTEGVFGDAAGYEETLFKTQDGLYFLYVNGGPDSPHPKEGLSRMSAKRAEEWLSMHID